MCTRPFVLHGKNGEPDRVLPCGKCPSCKINHAREWSQRLLMEFDTCKKGQFVTLTYDDAHLKDLSLHKDDLQLFFHDIRNDLRKSHRKIKYFACGEYGDHTHRPHYHAIIFNLGLNKKDTKLVFDNWNYGFVKIGTVTYDSCRYVAQYIDKKFGEKGNRSVYEATGRIPPFQLQSQGIGLDYFNLHKDEILDKGYMMVSRCGRNVRTSIPRYFVKKFELELDGNVFKPSLPLEQRAQKELNDKRLRANKKKRDPLSSYFVDSSDITLSKIEAINEEFLKDELKHKSLLGSNSENKYIKDLIDLEID